MAAVWVAVTRCQHDHLAHETQIHALIQSKTQTKIQKKINTYIPAIRIEGMTAYKLINWLFYSV